MPNTDELKGRSLTGQRGTYRLDKLLGAGLTARVYSAFASFDADEEQAVAVKVLRPGLGEEERRRFRAEQIHLSALLGHRASAAPEYYEYFETSEPDTPEVLVLELMTGHEVADLLLEKGHLPEPEGLSLGVQLAELLAVLHDKMRQTYTDLKFENLWWDTENGMLKVTDWNVLSDPGDLSRVSSDLLSASLYIYTVLTGGEVHVSGDDVTTNFRLNETWPALSIGVQELLSGTLLKNPEKPASELAIELGALLRFWTERPKLLLAQLEREIGNEYQRERYLKARRGLDILRKREMLDLHSFSASDEDTLHHLLNLVEGRLEQEQKPFDGGIHLFRGRSFPEAAAMFAEILRDDPWSLPALRWREAARAGEVTTDYKEHLKDVEQALDALDNGEYDRAEEMLGRINVPALASVLREAQTRRLVIEAKELAAGGKVLIDEGRGDTPEAEAALSGAQAAFIKAADTLRQITPDDYRKQVTSDGLEDLAKKGRALADERRQAAARASGSLRQAEATFNAGDYGEAYEHLWIGLDAVPNEPRLLEAGFRFGQDRFQARDMAMATSFLALVSKAQPSATEPRQWWRLAAGVRESTVLLDADSWQSGLDKAGRLVSGSIPTEAQFAIARSLQDVIERTAQRPTAALDFGSIIRLVDMGQQLAELDPGLGSWADGLRTQLPDMLRTQLSDRHLDWAPERVAVQVEQALIDARDPYTIAGALQTPVGNLMVAVPADGDLANAHLVLKSAELLSEYGREPENSEWQALVKNYRSTLENEENQRRAHALEVVQSFLLGLMQAEDKSSLDRARRSLDEALLLTPEDSEEYARLLALQAQLDDRWELVYGGADARSQVEAFLTGFDDELGAIRSTEELDALAGRLTLMRDRAAGVRATDLVEACTAKEVILQQVWTNRPKTEVLEAELTTVAEQLSQLGENAGVPGIEALQDERWRKLALTAATILDLHPHHTDAMIAELNYEVYTESLGLADRVRVLEQLKTGLGQPLQDLERAEAFHRSGQAREARQSLDRIPPVWADLDDVKTLSKEVATGVAFLTEAEVLVQQPNYDANRDKALQQVLAMPVSAAYVQRSGLVAGLGQERNLFLRRASDGKPSAKRTPQLLGQLVAADQYLRFANGRIAGQPVEPAKQPPNVSTFVEQALSAMNEKDRDSGQQIEMGLAALPLVAEPSRLAVEVQQQSGQWFEAHSTARRNRILIIAGAIVGGALLLAALVALAAMVWPGWRTELGEVSATATAIAEAPTSTPVQVPVIITATSTPVPPPTDTPVPPPTDTPEPPPTDTPTPEPERAKLSISNAGGAVLRSKPAANGDDLGIAGSGEVFDVIGQNQNLDGTWFQILREDGSLAWVFSSLTQLDGDINTVPALGQSIEKALVDAFSAEVPAVAVDSLTAIDPNVLAGSNVVAILDNADSEAGLYRNDAPADSVESYSDDKAGLLGGLTFLKLGAPPDALEELNFRWPQKDGLEAATYRMFVFVPELHSTVDVAYSVESGTGGVFVEQLLNGNASVSVTQMNFKGKWVDLGEFTLDSGGDVRVLARPSGEPGDGNVKQAAFDAIAIIRMP